MESKLLDMQNLQEKLHLYFGIYDYVVFALMLVVCAIIGIYFSIKRSTTGDVAKDYILGGRSMSLFPISISLIATAFSGISYLGMPTEVYFYGTNYTYTVLGIIPIGVACKYLFLPVLYEMELSSTYKYLERRFDKKVRLLAAIGFTILMVLWMPAMIYAPALAFNQVTGVNIHITTICLSILCIFYTTVVSSSRFVADLFATNAIITGGLKGVVWTDVVQTFVMTGAITVTFIKGTMDIGGFDLLWQRNVNGQRFDFPSFKLDFTDRHSVWSVLIGQSIQYTTIGVLNQNMIQRYMALPTMQQVKRGLWIFVFGLMFLTLLSSACGLLLYAKYYDCDPLTTNLIKRRDQLLPLLIMQTLGEYPGLPGFFVAGVFSATLSSISTGLNSLSAVVLEDFVKLSFPSKTFSPRTSIIIMKSVVVVFGALSVALVFVIEKLGAILQLTISFSAIYSGFSVAIFCGGMLIPWMNSNGAFYGGLIGLCINGFIVITAQKEIGMGRIKFPTKPLSVQGCDYIYNVTSIVMTNSTSIESDVFPLFKMSYLWYPAFGGTITLILAMVISYFTGLNDPLDVDPSCFSPVVRKYLPKRKVRENEILLTPN